MSNKILPLLLLMLVFQFAQGQHQSKSGLKNGQDTSMLDRKVQAIQGDQYTKNIFSESTVETSSDAQNIKMSTTHNDGGEGNTTALYNSFTVNSGSGKMRGIFTTLTSTGSGESNVMEGYLTGTGSGIRRTFNLLTEGRGNGLRVGIQNKVIGTGDGERYGINNEVLGYGNGTRYGIKSNVVYEGTGAVNGVKSSLTPMSGTEATNGFYYIDAGCNYSGNLVGMRSDVNSCGTSPFVAAFSANAVDNGTNSSSVGYNLQSYGSGSGSRKGAAFWVSGSGNGQRIGISSILQGTGNGTRYGIFNEVGGSDVATAYGSYTSMTATNGGNTWGEYINCNVNGNGLHVGSEIIMRSPTNQVKNGLVSTVLDYPQTLRHAVWGHILHGTENSSAIYGCVDSGSDGWAALFEGDVNVIGVVYDLSDRQIKQNISDLNPMMEKFKNLRPVSYQYRKDIKVKTPDGDHMGLIAQEVETVFPDLVKDIQAEPMKFNQETGKYEYTTPIIKEYKTLNYIGLIPVLIKVVQEQQTKIEELEARIKKLE